MSLDDISGREGAGLGGWGWRGGWPSDHDRTKLARIEAKREKEFRIAAGIKREVFKVNCRVSEWMFSHNFHMSVCKYVIVLYASVYYIPDVLSRHMSCK